MQNYNKLKFVELDCSLCGKPIEKERVAVRMNASCQDCKDKRKKKYNDRLVKLRSKFRGLKPLIKERGLRWFKKNHIEAYNAVCKTKEFREFKER